MAYDLAVIGAGPGGYVAAIRAAQLGAKVALLERDQVGGVCLNYGCIPTKAMIATAHLMDAVGRAGEFGVILPDGAPRIDMPKVRERKDEVVSRLRQGVVSLLRGHGIEWISGAASFASKDRLTVDGRSLDAKQILIATGSTWIELPNLIPDEERIVTTDRALSWAEVPNRLVVVGGGVIGCEMACLMRAFGSQVTVVEAMPSILPHTEAEISRLLARSFKRQGIEVITRTTVDGAIINGDVVALTLSDGRELTTNNVLVAVGRRALTDGLNLDTAGVRLDERGFIRVDERFRTTAKGVFAIGDVIGPPMLAHAASTEGIAAVEGIFGRGKDYDAHSVPSPIFTTPEIAAVGQTAERLKAQGTSFRTGRAPFASSGKAHCDGEIEGEVIVHADNKGKILGVHIIGDNATALIGEAALAIDRGLTISDLEHTIHAHPTLSEALAEAAADVEGRAIHKMRAMR